MTDTQLLTSATHATQQVTKMLFFTNSLLIQVGFVLVGILMLIVSIAWVVRKFGLIPSIKHNTLVKIVSNCLVGQKERVVVIEIEGAWLVLGVTNQQSTLLHSLLAKSINEPSSSVKSIAKPFNFRQFLNKVITRPEKSE